MSSCDNNRTAQPLQISALSTSCDMDTVITDNGDGTVTANNANGTTVTWSKDDNFVTITDNGDGTLTATNPNGSTSTWTIADTNTFCTILDNGDDTVTGVNVDGSQITWSKTDTAPVINDNGNGTITITLPDGSTTTFVSTGEIVSGVGVDISGTGTSADPFVPNIQLCSVPQKTQAEMQGAATVLTAGCVDGVSSLFSVAAIAEQVAAIQPPVQEPFACVPVVMGQPQASPAAGSGPLRADCDGSMWLWTCGDTWDKLSFGIPALEALNPADVANICADLKMQTWYDAGGGCVKQAEITMEQISTALQNCVCASIPTQAGTNATHAIDCDAGTFVRRPVPPPFVPCANGDGGDLAEGVTLVGCDNRSYTVPADLKLPPATMNLNSAFNTPISIGQVNIVTVSYVDDPNNLLDHIAGGIRVNRDGVYIINAEITSNNSAGYFHVGIYLNGVALDNGFPNSSSNSTGPLNATQFAGLYLSSGDILRAGVTIMSGAGTMNHANLSVTYIG